jgi:hypothetical protein
LGKERHFHWNIFQNAEIGGDFIFYNNILWLHYKIEWTFIRLLFFQYFPCIQWQLNLHEKQTFWDSFSTNWPCEWARICNWKVAQLNMQRSCQHSSEVAIRLTTYINKYFKILF